MKELLTIGQDIELQYEIDESGRKSVNGHILLKVVSTGNFNDFLVIKNGIPKVDNDKVLNALMEGDLTIVI